jgi:hypothetical protein
MWAARWDTTKTSLVVPPTRSLTATPPLLGVMPISPVASVPVATSSTSTPLRTKTSMPICHIRSDATFLKPSPTWARTASKAAQELMTAGADLRLVETWEGSAA